MDARKFVQSLLADFEPVTDKPSGQAFASSNIALVKYWGKRNLELNLPITDSFSVSLGNKGTTTQVALANTHKDEVTLNGQTLSAENPFYTRLTAFLNLFRPNSDTFYTVNTTSNLPIAAGLASSASGFAALTLALDDFYDWHLPNSALSCLSRLGSGSACRSIFSGFAEWHKGEEPDGSDSFAEPFAPTWPELRIGLLTVNTQQKPISSRQAMLDTVNSSLLYQSWPKQVEQDLERIKEAITDKDFQRFGQTAEHNALTMHATMMASWPPILYNQPETLAHIQTIWALRADGLPLYFTQDAGPNLKLLFLKEHEHEVLDAFPDIEIITPFEQN